MSKASVDKVPNLSTGCIVQIQCSYFQLPGINNVDNHDFIVKLCCLHLFAGMGNSGLQDVTTELRAGVSGSTSLLELPN